MGEILTRNQIWQEGTTRLARAGVENARFQAELLLRFTLDLNRVELFAHGGKTVDESEVWRYRTAVARRAANEPLQYIAGKQEFYRREFMVTPAVLIPRPETEFAVEAAIAAANARRDVDEPVRIVDLGSGSGAISVTLALEIAEAQATAVDISAAALAVATTNARRLGAELRMNFVRADMVEFLRRSAGTKRAGNRWHVVISNPPYIPAPAMAALPLDVKHEPGLALAGGADGLYFYRRLAPLLPGALLPGGTAVFEVGDGQAESVAALMGDAGLADVRIIPDLQGIGRVVVARAGGAGLQEM
jgi:release factor glutamine methyltransferase